VTAVGKAAHSAYPQLGVNAIELAGKALTRLTDLATELRGQRSDASQYFPDCPHPVLNVGLIAGGSAVNVVPEKCELQFGVRLLPGQRSTEIRERIDRAIASVPVDPQGMLRWDVVNDSPPMLCDERAPLHRELCELVGQRQSASVSYASDAGWLSTLGLECVLFGPGSIEDAHRANEAIDVAQWREGGLVLDAIIGRLCVGEPA
jgi:acetylornithine deacetylase